MKTITITKTVYTYEELSPEAKARSHDAYFEENGHVYNGIW